MLCLLIITIQINAYATIQTILGHDLLPEYAYSPPFFGHGVIRPGTPAQISFKFILFVLIEAACLHDVT